MRQILFPALISVSLLTACSQADDPVASAGTEVTQTAPANEVRKLNWEELLPEGEEAQLAALYQQQLLGGSTIAEGGLDDVATQIGTFNTVPELEGLRIRLPGYTVPFDYGVEAEISEFLLVPYFGACLHAPPPPPNQTIYVRTAEPIKLADLAQAVWVEGTLRASTQRTSLADAAYTIEMDIIEAY